MGELPITKLQFYFYQPKSHPTVHFEQHKIPQLFTAAEVYCQHRKESSDCPTIPSVPLPTYVARTDVWDLSAAMLIFQRRTGKHLYTTDIFHQKTP